MRAKLRCQHERRLKCSPRASSLMKGGPRHRSRCATWATSTTSSRSPWNPSRRRARSRPNHGRLHVRPGLPDPASGRTFRSHRASRPASPGDVESLFVAALRILPSGAPLPSEALAQTTLELSLAGRFKLFYRPKALAAAFGVEEARQRLTAECSSERAISAQFLALLGHVCFGRAQRAQSAARGPEADDCAQKRASARGARLSERKPLSVFADRGNRHGDARAGDPHWRLTDALRRALPRRAS